MVELIIEVLKERTKVLLVDTIKYIARHLFDKYKLTAKNHLVDWRRKVVNWFLNTIF